MCAASADGLSVTFRNTVKPQDLQEKCTECAVKCAECAEKCAECAEKCAECAEKCARTVPS